MKFLSILLVVNIAAILIMKVDGDECARPKQIQQFEETCFEEHTGFIERVQHKATNLFASAKKRLGFADDNEPNAKKCDYYQCIFNKMDVMIHHGIPDKQKLTEKYAAALPIDNATLQKCFEMPENMETVLHKDEASFDIMHTDNPKTTIKEARDTMNDVICEINAHVHRCLSAALKDTECPFLVYP